MKSPSAWNILALVACSHTALIAVVLATGCALPSRLGLADQDSLNKLTQHDDPAEPSPYPTSLNNPQRVSPTRQQVSRPVTVAPLEQPTPQQATQPQTPLLPLQQQPPPPAMPLRREELFNRLPIHLSDPAQQTSQPVARPNQHAPEAIVLTPTSVDVQELFAAKESAWLPPLVTSDVKRPWPPQSPETPASSSAEEPADDLTAKPKADPNQDSHADFNSNSKQGEKPDQKPKDKPEPAPSIDELLEKLIASVEHEIRERTKNKEEAELPALEQKLRLLQLVADRSDDAVAKIDRLPAAEREAFKQLMFALSTWLSPDEAKRASLRNAKILRTLQEVDNRLATSSKLDLKNLTFCEKVESFGWFTEFSRAEFAPKQQVILYVEVQNFAAEEKTATSFETELQGSYQIFDAAGSIVDERQLPLDREVCRNFRRDYFLAYRIYLPGELTPGRYRLELAIEDLKAKKDFKGRKQGEAMIEFAIK